MGEETDRIAPWRWLLLGQAAALRAIEADLDEVGTIPLTWYDVLLELHAAPDRRLRMSDLAERVVLSRTRVSRVVDDLVVAGLVKRTPADDDRRSVHACITTKGAAELRRAAPHYAAGIDRHFVQLLSADERRVIARALRRVAEHHRNARRTRR